MRFGDGNFVRGDSVMVESATKGLGREAVSYTHLDVYKRQCYIIEFV